MMNPKLFKERGQALILIAFAGIALFAITGLAIDGSNKFSDRRHAQNAADTAALTGALAKANAETAGDDAATVSTKLVTAALNRAADNGYDGDLVTNVVQVNSPPVGGPYAGNIHYVQVIITSYVDTFFTRVIGINQSTNIVQAVALSGKGGSIANGALSFQWTPVPDAATAVLMSVGTARSISPGAGCSSTRARAVGIRVIAAALLLQPIRRELVSHLPEA